LAGLKRLALASAVGGGRDPLREQEKQGSRDGVKIKESCSGIVNQTYLNYIRLTRKI